MKTSAAWLESRNSRKEQHSGDEAPPDHINNMGRHAPARKHAFTGGNRAG
jgi:hypothetical protein